MDFAFTAKPWEIDTGLKKEHLTEIAEIIQQVRHETLELHEPEKGDGPWSLGCRIYERTINTIEELAKRASWLNVVREHLYFVMMIEGVPSRFYKGKAEEPTTRTLRLRYPELEYRQLSFREHGWFWRFAVDPEEDGTVFRITIAQYDGRGGHRHLYEIPLSEPVTIISPVVEMRRESTVLDAPVLVRKTEKAARDEEDVG